MQRALRDIEPKLLREFQTELRAAGEPVARAAHALAVQNIAKVTDPWSEFRVGSTTRMVYVAPRQRGSKAGSRKRPNFATLLIRRALEPAVPLAERELESRAEIAMRTVIAKAGL